MNSCSTEGEVRLEGGDNKFVGRVEVCLGGCWSGVCLNALWDSFEEIVLCRQLGHLERDSCKEESDKYFMLIYSPFLLVEGRNQFDSIRRHSRYVMLDVNCFTFEERLIDCSHQIAPGPCDQNIRVECMEGGE